MAHICQKTTFCFIRNSFSLKRLTKFDAMLLLGTLSYVTLNCTGTNSRQRLIAARPLHPSTHEDP